MASIIITASLSRKSQSSSPTRPYVLCRTQLTGLLSPGYYVTSEEGQKAGKRVWADIIERLAPVAPEIKTLAKI